MHKLLTTRGDTALVRAMRLRPLLAFDFDGTLAPIVDRPREARVPLAVSARLSWLAAHLPLAVVTGRSIADVRHRLGFVPRYVVGNHGAEASFITLPTFSLRRDLDPLRQRLLERSAALLAAGIQVEDKALSIALHYRLARHPAQARAIIDELVSGLPASVRVFGGKMVLNATAATAPDKAYAVHQLLARSGCRSVVYVGDDVNDEPVFSAAAADWLTVRVGRDNRASQARYYLGGTSEVPEMLERMLAHVKTA